MTTLEIGTLVDEAGAPALLDATRFNRHTFWCGQSGSGKTYALGVVLEQLLLRTRLPLLVLDPNGDFVRLHETRAGAPADVGDRWADLGVRVLRSGDAPGERLHARFVDLPLRSKAAVLRLDPLADRDEFNVLLHIGEHVRSHEPELLHRYLSEADDSAHAALLRRIENLGTLGWDLWARGEQSVEDVVDTRPRATVMDLGGFRDQGEPQAAALAVLDHLWATRERREPVLVVVDEAHNICPPDPVTPLETALTERVVQIAAEGRKFGLWLLLSTQRPSKVHPNALSQCDNLGLMRMSSPRDLAELTDVFGYAPADLVGASPRFPQGRALFAGGFTGGRAALVQVGARLTPEGGSDVRVPL